MDQLTPCPDLPQSPLLKEIQNSLQALRSSINLDEYQEQNKFIVHPHKGNYNQPSYASVIKSYVNMSDKINLQKSAEIFSSQNTVDTSKSKWISVSQKRFRPKIKIGKNICSNIKAVKKVSKPTEIFATRFQPDITESDIKSYIISEFCDVESISIKKLKAKYSTYSSFKIFIIGISLKDALNEESWPEGIFVKRFYAPKMESTASAVNTSHQNIQS